MTGAPLMSSLQEDTMETKISMIRNAWAEGDKQKALLIASRFPRLGIERNAIKTAASAILSPSFYISIGKSPESLVEAGYEALQNKYGL